VDERQALSPGGRIVDAYVDLAITDSRIFVLPDVTGIQLVEAEQLVEGK
jgi:hypothetical protein